MFIPEGFAEHDGKGRPSEVGEDDFVVLIVRTGEGFGFSGPMRARLHNWEQDAPEGHGHIVAWRKAVSKVERVDNVVRWKEKVSER
jgi:hypothetical protein